MNSKKSQRSGLSPITPCALWMTRVPPLCDSGQEKGSENLTVKKRSIKNVADVSLAVPFRVIPHTETTRLTDGESLQMQTLALSVDLRGHPDEKHIRVGTSSSKGNPHAGQAHPSRPPSCTKQLGPWQRQKARAHITPCVPSPGRTWGRETRDTRGWSTQQSGLFVTAEHNRHAPALWLALTPCFLAPI